MAKRHGKATWQSDMAKRDDNMVHSLDTGTRTENEKARSIADRFCVLISSSDRGHDIFEIVFQNTEKIWRDCDWPRYVGFTSQHPDLYGFKALAAKAPSDWRGEVGDYLDALPDHIDYVLRLDEDVLFLAPVDGKKLNAIAELMARENLSYVRLIPVCRNFAGLIVEYFRRRLSKHPLRRLSFSEPYYSSVGVAIWKRSYLRSLLRQPGSIWEFEHTVTSEPHYAVWEPVLDQDQIVRRGKWSRHAAQRLADSGLSIAHSNRDVQTLGSWLRGIRERISCEVAGYSSFRLRRRLGLRLHR
jgi:hypothetical protein